MMRPSSVGRKRQRCSKDLRSALLLRALARAATSSKEAGETKKKPTLDQDNMQNLPRSPRRDLNAGPCGCGCASTLVKVVLVPPHTRPHAHKTTNLFSHFVCVHVSPFGVNRARAQITGPGYFPDTERKLLFSERPEKPDRPPK